MELTKSLEHRRAYEKLEEICRRAVRMDPQEETVYCRLVRALMHQGKTAEDTEHMLLNDGMEKMETVLGRVLPAGTAVTKYSPDQYLFLLPCFPYEEAKMMTKQNAYRFYTADRKGKVQVFSDLKELYQEPRELEKIN